MPNVFAPGALSPDDALDRLRAGNGRFVRGEGSAVGKWRPGATFIGRDLPLKRRGRVTGSEHELHDLAEVMEVLPSVEEIDDLSGLGKVPGGEVPRNRARGPGTRRRPGGSG